MHSIDSSVARHLSLLTAAIDGLLDDELTPLSDADVLDGLRDLENGARRLAAVSHRLIVEATERSIPAAHGLKSMNRLLVDVLGISSADANARVAAARELGVWHTVAGEGLAETLAETAAAQRNGEIGAEHARAVHKVMGKVPARVEPSERSTAEKILAECARTGTPEDVERAGHRLLACLNPDGDGPDHRDRARRRSVRIGRQGGDLMSPISGELDPTTRALLDPILVKWARPGLNNPDDPESPDGDGGDVPAELVAAAAKRDTRTSAQRNHDALSALFRIAVESNVLGRHRGLPATVIITMTVEQLERAAGGPVGTGNGTLLPISDALKLAERAHPVLAVFDHRGRPLHFGRERRLASPEQRLALIAADRGCTRPGCDAPASMCAAHHITEWERGGTTDIDNLTLVCDACHARVNDTRHGWTTVRGRDGSDYPGRTHWIRPRHVDPLRKPTVNHRHHPDELLERARRAVDAGADEGVP